MSIAAKCKNIDKSTVYKWLSLLLILITLWFVLHRAWYCDDAYITYRTLDNFVNGYHLTWNTYERVQAYTHPLWLFLLIPFYAITREIYLTGIVLMVVLTAGALVFLYKSVEDKSKLVLPLLGLALSNAFINFSTSGLENALLNFLLSVMIFMYVKYAEKKHFQVLFYFLCNLIALTRLDAILFVLPAMVVVFVQYRAKWLNRIGALLLGFMPLIWWELFSLFYYGFLFPNTFYAKLTAGFPLKDYLWRGLVYLGDTITRDPLTAVGVLLGSLAVFVLAKRLKALSIGVFLYFLYVFYIGGDFMSGRMYASAFFVAMVLLGLVDIKIRSWQKALIPVVFVALGALAECPTPLLAVDKPLGNTVYNIMDERRFYYLGTSMFRFDTFNTGLEKDETIFTFGGYPWIVEARAQGDTKLMDPVVRISTGFVGYYGGPDLKIIDTVGLSDPLIARLPSSKNPNWRPGHLVRDVPAGYKESIIDPDAHIQDARIDEFNQHLRVLTRAPLFSKGRLLEIIRFNLGYYDYLVEE
jgi:arabinofuranosyltransferase